MAVARIMGRAPPLSVVRRKRGGGVGWASPGDVVRAAQHGLSIPYDPGVVSLDNPFHSLQLFSAPR